MIPQLKQIKERVEYVLEQVPEARNSDKVLIGLVWRKFYPDLIHTNLVSKDYVFLSDLMHLPSPESIRRVRQKIQNTEGKYPPTSWEVARKRRFLESEWRLALGYTNQPDYL